MSPARAHMCLLFASLAAAIEEGAPADRISRFLCPSSGWGVRMVIPGPLATCPLQRDDNPYARLGMGQIVDFDETTYQII